MGEAAILYLKCEQLQPIGAFKIRGAYTAIARLRPDAPGPRGRHLLQRQPRTGGGLRGPAIRRPGVIVMPDSAPAVKVDGVRRHGGEVVFVGKTRRPNSRVRADANCR